MDEVGAYLDGADPGRALGSEIEVGLRSYAADVRPTESPAAVVGVVQDWLAAHGKQSEVPPGGLRVAVVAASQLLQALNVRPSIAPGGRTQQPPAQAGPAGQEEKGSVS